MRIRIRKVGAPAPEPGIFSSGLPTRRGGWLPWVGSLAAHGLAVALITALGNFASWVTYGNSEAAGYIEPLRLRTAFYYIPDRPLPPEVQRVQPRRTPAPARPQTAHVPAPPDPPKLVIQRQFELPPAPVAASRAPVMLQPKVRVNAPRPQTPALAYWARQDSIPKPDRKQFVVPGRVEAAAAAPRLTAPPVLRIPNRELRLADVNIGSSLPQLPSPALPAPPSATSPLRTDRGLDSQAAALDSTAGQAGVNVIALGAKLPSGELLTIPGGLVTAPAADRRDPGNSSAERSTATATRPGSGNEPGSGNGSTGDPYAALPPIRIEHSPGGKFDAVLMQSAARDDLAAAGGVLSGNPVYSVYLDVGDRKEWLLEFCAPAAPKPASNPYQVFVDAPAVLAAPYPLLTVIPAGVVHTSRAKYVVMHGFLTSTGGFRDVTAPNTKDPIAQAVLPILAQWRFRPATRDRQPVEVEILLVIPPET